jgi:hypothetical protein
MILSRDYLPSPTLILSTCDITCYDMRMWVGPKNTGQVPNAYDSSNSVSNQFWSENTAVQIYLKKKFYFQFGFLFLKTRKADPRKLYLRVLVWITESLYSGGRTPSSGSASTYVGSGVTSYSASGSE